MYDNPLVQHAVTQKHCVSHQGKKIYLGGLVALGNKCIVCLVEMQLISFFFEKNNVCLVSHLHCLK